MSKMTSITILGATGSIGSSTLDVVARHPDQYRIFALTANTNVDALAELCLQWQPEYAVMNDEYSAIELKSILKSRSLSTTVLFDTDGLKQVVEDDAVDCVVAAIVGAAGLVPTLAAAKAGKRVLLANKEALVMSGQLFIDTARKNDAVLLPVDSEHNAIFQCLPESLTRQHSSVKQTNAKCQSGIERILLTASGGPFRTYTAEQLDDVTPEQAVNHPNWDMGKKISVDSATLMNKGLELIEAFWLFDMDIEHIDVVIHPQSVIHSMVSYNDGSVLAQLGNPDMRTPIAHTLAWPQRIESGVEPLNIFDVAKLEFEKPDLDRFPCLRLCYEAIRAGGTATVVLNAANEVAVDAFLENRIRFTDIARLIESTLEKADVSLPVDTLETILQADKIARSITNECIGEMHSKNYERVT